MRVALVDTDIANLGSVSRVIGELGSDAVIVRDPSALMDADRIILPGVGSFVAGMESLERAGFDSALREQAAAGVPLLGICLGMQLLGDYGEEAGGAAGLGLIGGRIEHFQSVSCRERVPHMGWNSVSIPRSSHLTQGIGDGTDFYFVHSYVFRPNNEEDVVGWADYGARFAAIVSAGNVHGAQFHPEKSSRAGFRLIENFLRGS